MTDLFVLDIQTDPDKNRAVLRLTDSEGVHLGANEVQLSDGDASSWEGLFDMREHVERYSIDDSFQPDYKKAGNLISQLGVFLAEQVLGDEIFSSLHKGILCWKVI